MLQVFQNLKTGHLDLAEIPMPVCKSGSFLIQTNASLISAGTERMLVDFGRASYIGKAKSQPDKVKQVIDKIKSDGLMPTLEAVFNRLDEPMPLGYCNAGKIVETFERDHVRTFERFHVGDRVVSNGPHAEIVSVPCNLCAKIPDGVSDEQAAFTVLGSIGLQGIRLYNPSLGDRVVVYGLGLVGLLTVQMLKASGCQVLGIDLNPDRLQLAQSFGAAACNPADGVDPVTTARNWTNGNGVDGVLITAAAKTDEIVHHSAQMSRKRGKIIVVGTVGMHLKRSDFYDKELIFQTSCSYGPGRYDENYEEKGQDYPYGFVRWTEQRNFEAVLELLQSGRLNVDPLISHRFALKDAAQAYDLIRRDNKALGVILTYDRQVDLSRTVRVTPAPASTEPQKKAVVALIGAGNFTKVVFMPALAKTRARLACVVSQGGASAHYLAKKFHAEKAVSDYGLVLADQTVNTVAITLRHNMHAPVLIEALNAGKHVFVEKPLAMTINELIDIVQTVKKYPGQQLLVGFNRRFSPHVRAMKKHLKGRSEPLALNMTINAGIIPDDHWAHDPEIGGGRIIGEGCHFIDLMVHLTGSLIHTVSAIMMHTNAGAEEDKMSITLGFEDGSVGTINYFANGPKSYPKESFQVFSQGRVMDLHNFRKLKGYGFKGLKTFKTSRQDKGHSAELEAFVKRIESGGDYLIPLQQLVNVSLAAIAATTSAKEKRTIAIDEEYKDVIDLI